MLTHGASALGLVNLGQLPYASSAGSFQYGDNQSCQILVCQVQFCYLQDKSLRVIPFQYHHSSDSHYQFK
ncbi:hypothetical protein P8452_59468 [Trifolium repens]|nr:hypothetical protein P8452_59468 [Trifolium repens]